MVASTLIGAIEIVVSPMIGLPFISALLLAALAFAARGIWATTNSSTASNVAGSAQLRMTVRGVCITCQVLMVILLMADSDSQNVWTLAMLILMVLNWLSGVFYFLFLVDKSLRQGKRFPTQCVMTMTLRRFRQLALSLPETSESEHMNHPDFRVRGKIFATLFPGEERGVVKLTPELQTELLNEEPNVFAACNGAWGRNGATIVFLKDAEEGSVLRALISAWRKTAPKSLTKDFDDQNV